MSIPLVQQYAELHTTAILERARQMTRRRKRKIALRNKIKKEIELKKNPKPIPYKVELMLKRKGLWGTPPPLRDPDDKPFPGDDVYLTREHTWKRWDLGEALEELRLLNHPSFSWSKPGPRIVEAKVEIDMRASKKDKFIEEFSRPVPIMHSFDRGVPDRNVLVFTATEEQATEAMEAGAYKTGDADLISEISKGRIDVADVDHFVAHDDMAGEMGPLKNILRDKVPSVILDTVGPDVGILVKTFAKGMTVDIKKVKPQAGVAGDEPDYGYCVFPIGTLDMTLDQVSLNLDVVLDRLMEKAPKRKDPKDNAWLTRCIIGLQGDTEPTSKFSVLRDVIVDKKGRTQDQELEKGRSAVQQKVADILKATS